MLTAEAAVLHHLESVGIIFLVLLCVVVPLFAFTASHRDLNSHYGTSRYFFRILSDNYLPQPKQAWGTRRQDAAPFAYVFYGALLHGTQKKTSPQRCNHCITYLFFCQELFSRICFVEKNGISFRFDNRMNL